MVTVMEHTGVSAGIREFWLDAKRKWKGITLGAGSYCRQAWLDAGSRNADVLIGRYAVIGANVRFIVGRAPDCRGVTAFPFEALALKHDAHESLVPCRNQVCIGNDAQIGDDAVLFGGVRIGDGAVVAPGAVVMENVPPYHVAAGNPATAVEARFDAKTIQKLLDICWWDWPQEEVGQARGFMGDADAFIAHFWREPPAAEETPWSHKARALYEQGIHIYYMRADFGSGDTAWEPLVFAFLTRFSVRDKVALFLEMPPSSVHAAACATLFGLLGQRGSDAPQVAVQEIEEPFPKAVFPYVGTFLMTKEEESLLGLQQAERCGVRVAYALDSAELLFPADGRHEPVKGGAHAAKRRIWDQRFAWERERILDYLLAQKTEAAMQLTASVAEALYAYNQLYVDDRIESYLRALQLLLPQVGQRAGEAGRVLFYDRFGYESRGLAQIYVRALADLADALCYIAPAEAEGRIQKLEEIVHAAGGQVLYLDLAPTVANYTALCHAVQAFAPAHSFLYTEPQDVTGVLAFMQMEGKSRRYQINLTDHAFWLGANAFDYSLKYRDYGAVISRDRRRVEETRILYQPYYPVVDYDVPFAGYPFARAAGDFIIFSGGFLYKTMDAAGTYYRLVGTLLARFPQVKFWYAGFGDDSGLRTLMERYPGRVFHTTERKDLYQILKNIDMYLSTCPQGGGLMTQYAALAGKPPYILDYNGFHHGFLLHEEELGIHFCDYDACLAELSRYIGDAAYRRQKDALLMSRARLIDADAFRANLQEIMAHGKSRYPLHFYDADETIARQEEIYFERFIQDDA